MNARPVSLHHRDDRIVLRLARNGETMATVLRPMKIRDAFAQPYFFRRR